MRNNNRYHDWREGLTMAGLILAAAIILIFTTSIFHVTEYAEPLDQSKKGQPLGITKPEHPQNKGEIGTSQGVGESGADKDGNAALTVQNTPETVQCGVFKMAGDDTQSNVQVPMYCISGNYAISDGPVSLTPITPLPVFQNLEIPLENQSKLGAYWLSDSVTAQGHVILAPRSWKVVEAMTGADGSVRIEMADPNDSNVRLVYSDAGGCGGCATGKIGTYFPMFKAWAKSLGAASDDRMFASQEMIDEHVIMYSMPHPEQQYEIWGGSYQNHEKDYTVFSNLEIHSMRKDHLLMTSMLDFFTKYPFGYRNS